MRAAAALVLTIFTSAAWATACGSTSSSVTPSPTADVVGQRFVDLVHQYWIAYKTAEGDLDHIDGTSTAPFGNQDAARVCFGLASPTTPQDLVVVDPQTCAKVSAAMLAVHEKFLADLGVTPAPPRLASEVAALKAQLPVAIADMKAMVSASSTGDKQAVEDATASYVSAMVPTVTDALNSIDPTVIHN